MSLLRRVALALVVSVGLSATGCSSSDPPSADDASSPTTAPTAAAPDAPEWAKVDRALDGLGPDVGFLAARVSSDGTCDPVHTVAASTARPTASQFKLFVLGALAEEIAAGRISWSQTVTMDESYRSLGNSQASGSIQFVAAGAPVVVEDAATKMISISDNTAADMLLTLVGRERVEEQTRRWTAHAAANEPFLRTRQMFLLHYAAGVGDQYLALPKGQRAAFLASSVDPLPLSAVGTGYSADPRYVDDIEWFASPEDICRSFAGLHELSSEPTLSPTLSTVLSREVGGIGLDPAEWPTVWFKGGSEPGVLTLGWLATNSDGDAFVVEAMVSDPDAVLAEDSITDLVALARDAFGLLG